MGQLNKSLNFDVGKYEHVLIKVLERIDSLEFTGENKQSFRRKYEAILREFPKPDKKSEIFSKDELIKAYYLLSRDEKLSGFKQPDMLSKLRMKPIRSSSGVIPLTLLTKPYPCPGNCIFCPLEENMPKSYLSNEPGAQRAVKNAFDPYAQVFNRLLAFRNTGHEASKIELIILGGSWSSYEKNYKIWFIKRCFEAMNDFGQAVEDFYQKKTDEIQSVTDFRLEEKTSWQDLENQQKLNETTRARNVGLVVETRPDLVDETEVVFLRKLGVTKVQLGVQSLDDTVLEKNKRGHGVDQTKQAFRLLRSAGFKIHVHWMANLYGSTPEKDRRDFLKLFQPDFQPDELKIYPCSLLEGTELMNLYKQGKWQPYSEAELKSILKFAIQNTPRYTRLTRVIRDIPSGSIVSGNKKTNMRQIVQNELRKASVQMKDIRAREIRNKDFEIENLELKETAYKAKGIFGDVEEIFLEYVTSKDEVCGFLRLSLPDLDSLKTQGHLIKELEASAIIREVHVYGTAKKLSSSGALNKSNGQVASKSAQHLGLGTKLVKKAKQISKNKGYQFLSVISAVGTRKYYEKLGFDEITQEKLYQTYTLNSSH
jgi:elongator complex protein 3